MKTYTTPKIDQRLLDILTKQFVDGKITVDQLNDAIRRLYNGTK